MTGFERMKSAIEKRLQCHSLEEFHLPSSGDYIIVWYFSTGTFSGDCYSLGNHEWLGMSGSGDRRQFLYCSEIRFVMRTILFRSLAVMDEIL